ncbi:MAG: DNA translocase FtsK [Ruminococcaceae bacterium]|nr:DNA translocase FtsK [Oscillospiraceae bacterium]
MNLGGAFFAVIRNIITALIGQVAFYVAIPATLYLFVIQAFSHKRPVIQRSVCLLVFVTICGCISQIVMMMSSNYVLPSSSNVLFALVVGGYEGSTAGLLCGGIGMLLHALFWHIPSLLILLVAGFFTLLASFQITIPSIIRAVQNRPRAEFEDEEPEEVEEPAAVVVNYLANKRIEHLENKRKEEEERQLGIDIPVDDTPLTPTKAERKLSPKASAFMSDVDADVETPVAAAKEGMSGNADVELILDDKTATANTFAMEETPAAMTPFAKEEQDDVTAEIAQTVAQVAETEAKKITAKEAQESAAQVAEEIALAQQMTKQEYRFPPIDLLRPSQRNNMDATMEMRENTRRLNETLASFKIEAHIVNVTRGPSVTRYEVELEKGVKLNKLTTCADDIALSLGASGVRIAAVPGKISVVGIEVPNRTVTNVSLREVIDSSEFAKAKSKSSFSVGKDIGGTCIVGNIAKLPHMLIAGTTGSGKSVCMNSIIVSLLYKASPEDVKLIMVDPKMVELGIYNGIPHLLIPVVTDPKKAAGSLQWAVTEMMRRYKAMSDAGVRDLESYNGIIEAEGEGSKIPQVVVIIDELADLMLVAAKEVEESICRIAQMGRAAGIHLVIATQRPSADVITGLMKANIPSRIAFAVASAMESRIILDTQGAEKLVGKGDMLYAPIGAGKPIRVQGCFVSDAEVEAVAGYVKDNFNTDYDHEVMEEIERKAAQAGSGKSAASDPEPTQDEMDGDEMLPAAVDVILETGQASVSMLQRRLKLGYSRAARIVDEMEEKGIVGPFQGSKPRSILITKEQWQAMRNGPKLQMGIDDMEDSGVPEEID